MRSRRIRFDVVSGNGDEKEETDERGPSTEPEETPPQVQPPPMIQNPPAPDANPIDPRTFWRP